MGTTTMVFGYKARHEEKRNSSLLTEACRIRWLGDEQKQWERVALLTGRRPGPALAPMLVQDCNHWHRNDGSAE